MKIFDILYDYQKEAVFKTKFHNRGIVCMPTGVGKTFCQASMIADDIMENSKGFNLYVVNAPRIILSYQLMREVYGFLIKSNIEARYMFVHSGGASDEKELEEIRVRAKEDGINIPFSQIGAGTSPRVIGEMMKTASKENLPLIFFSTYNSADRIQIAIENLAEFEEIFMPEISMVLNDEAHYLVQEQFHDIITNVPSSRCYFFTATMIHTPSDKGRGMNNEDLYGKVIYEMKPIDAIMIGKMVRPRLHVVTTEGVYNTDDYNKSLNKIIYSTFKQHEEVLIKMKPKMLISTKGTQDIISFLNSDEYRTLRSEGVDIYAVASSENIGNDINGEKVRRQIFLKRLKKDGDNHNKKLIVLHYDILAEGISVSGFTGIMPLRTLNKSKFLQTYGRSARPEKNDRKAIDDKIRERGVLDEKDWNDLLISMNKPYAYIMIPNIIHSNEDDRANIAQLITELRTYEFKPYEDILSSSMVHGQPKIDELDGLNNLLKRVPNVGQVIENLQMELEAEESAKLTKLQLVKKEFNR